LAVVKTTLAAAICMILVVGAIQQNVYALAAIALLVIAGMVCERIAWRRKHPGREFPPYGGGDGLG